MASNYSYYWLDAEIYLLDSFDYYDAEAEEVDSDEQFRPCQVDALESDYAIDSLY